MRPDIKKIDEATIQNCGTAPHSGMLLASATQWLAATRAINRIAGAARVKKTGAAAGSDI